MSGTKTILQLNSLDRTSITGSDLLLIADIRNRETKNIETSEFVNYVNNKLNVLLSGSFTGSFKGNLVGVSDSASYSLQSDYSKTSSNLLFSDYFNGTSSYSISSSNTLFSVSSSVSNRASFALSSFISDITLYAATTSSIMSEKCDEADYSLDSNLSETSSYLKYEGLDNGTAVSSSFSERTRHASRVLNILDKYSAVIANSVTSSFSLISQKSLSVISSSTADYAEYAESSSKPLFCSVKFFITVDGDGKIRVEPSSWKNVANISVDPSVISTKNSTKLNRYFTSDYLSGNNIDQPFAITFLVQYKKKPRISDPRANITPVVISNLQLNASNIYPKNYNDEGDDSIPYWYYTVNPCGLDGFIIKVMAYSAYLMKKSRFANTWFFNQFKILLNGATLSANVFCNTDDILKSGPDDTLSQQRQVMKNTYVSEGATFTQLETIDLSNLKTLVTTSGKTTVGAAINIVNNPIISIASNENILNSSNLVLFQDGYILNLESGNPLMTENEESVITTSDVYVYKPFISTIANAKTTFNFVYYDSKSHNNSGSYIIGHSRGITYISSSDAELRFEETDTDTVNNFFPTWKNNELSNKNVKSICGLDGTKYIFISGSSFTIPSSNSTSDLKNINILSSISSTSVTNPTIKTNKPEITTKLNSITRVNDTDAIAVGTSGCILYINGSNAYRVDDEGRSKGDRFYGSASISNLTDVKVYNSKSYVCGTDEHSEKCLLYANIPSNPSDASKWKWNPIILGIKPLIDIDGDEIISSSLNSLYLRSNNFISVGSSSADGDSIVYNLSGETFPFYTGTSSVEYNSIGYSGDTGNDIYLFGGREGSKAILNVYS